MVKCALLSPTMTKQKFDTEMIKEALLMQYHHMCIFTVVFYIVLSVQNSFHNKLA